MNHMIELSDTEMENVTGGSNKHCKHHCGPRLVVLGLSSSGFGLISIGGDECGCGCNGESSCYSTSSCCYYSGPSSWNSFGNYGYSN